MKVQHVWKQWHTCHNVWNRQEHSEMFVVCLSVRERERKTHVLHLYIFSSWNNIPVVPLAQWRGEFTSCSAAAASVLLRVLTFPLKQPLTHTHNVFHRWHHGLCSWSGHLSTAVSISVGLIFQLRLTAWSTMQSRTVITVHRWHSHGKHSN